MWKLEICQLDVGQGDSALVFFRGPGVLKSILIDGGCSYSANTIKRTLEEHHCRELNLVIISHLDNDHSGGIKELVRTGTGLINGNTKIIVQRGDPGDYSFLKGVETCPVLTTSTEQVEKLFPRTAKWGNHYYPKHWDFLRKPTDRPTIIYGLDVVNRDIWDINNEKHPGYAPNLRILGAGGYLGTSGNSICTIGGKRKKATNSLERNKNCIVVLITFGSFRFLTAGDLGKAQEVILADYLSARPIPVVKLSHHGSKNSTPPDYLNQLGAKCALISHGNRYDHPTDEVIEILQGSDINCAYLTNPKKNSVLGGKCIVCGDPKTISNAKNAKAKNPKGDMKISVNSAQAKKGQFDVEYMKCSTGKRLKRVRDRYTMKNYDRIRNEAYHFLGNENEKIIPFAMNELKKKNILSLTNDSTDPLSNLIIRYTPTPVEKLSITFPEFSMKKVYFNYKNTIMSRTTLTSDTIGLYLI